MKKIIIGSLVILMLTGCSAKANIEKDELEETVITKEDGLVDKYKKIAPISIETKLEEEVLKNIYDIRINRPQFIGFDEKETEDLINQRIVKDINEYAYNMRFIKEVEEGEERVSAYSFFIEPKVLTNENGILSIGLDIYEYSGGAHGNYWSQFYNFDLLRGKEVELKDFFKEDVNYLELIYKNIFEQIKENEVWNVNLKEYFYKDKVEPIFFIRDGKIYAYFSVYALGSYADGEHIFEIPLKSVEGKLSDIGEVLYSSIDNQH